MKLGLEVEGKLSGMYTLFMSASEALEFFSYESLKKRALPPGKANRVDKVQHIYISDHENTIRGDAACLREWFNLNLSVTLEVTAVENRHWYPTNVGIMLAIVDGPKSTFSSSFWKLDSADQVKFSRPSGGAHQVKCVMVGNMFNTNPREFSGDTEFTASRAKKFLSK